MKIKTILNFSRCLGVLCLMSPLVLFAQDGSLDPTFDLDGKVTTYLANGPAIAYAVKAQNDGKIVVAGYTYIGGNNHLLLIRYNPNGSLDQSFDNDGIVTEKFSTTYARGRSLALQSDGKIIVGGISVGTNPDFAIARYNTNGSLDSTFAQIGKDTFELGGTEELVSITLQSDGKIILLGNGGSGPAGITLLRLHPNGTVDSSFGANGIVRLDTSPYAEYAEGVALQSDGKIVVCGSIYALTDDFVVARLNTDGSYDSNFDSDGVLTTDFFGGDESASSIQIQMDGKIVVGGTTQASGLASIVVARYNSNGSLDNSFDGDGKFIGDYATGTDSDCFALHIQNNGKIVLSGVATLSGYDFGLVRLNANGSYDATFDNDGKQISAFTFSGQDQCFAMTLQNDSKILLVGFAEDSLNGGFNFAVARYNNTDIVGIEEIVTTQSILEVFPNPTSSSTTIRLSSKLNGGELLIYNAKGQIVTHLVNQLGNSISFDVSKLPNGVYFIRVLDNGVPMKEEKLLIAD